MEFFIQRHDGTCRKGRQVWLQRIAKLVDYRVSVNRYAIKYSMVGAYRYPMRARFNKFQRGAIFQPREVIDASELYGVYPIYQLFISLTGGRDRRCCTHRYLNRPFPPRNPRDAMRRPPPSNRRHFADSLIPPQPPPISKLIYRIVRLSWPRNEKNTNPRYRDA